MDAPLDRCHADTEDFGDLVIGQSLKLAQHERRALLRRQLQDRGGHGMHPLTAQGGLGGIVACIDVIVRQCVRGTALGEDVQATVGHDSVHPRRERAVATKASESPPRLHKTVLSGVLRISLGAEHPQRQTIDRALMAADEQLERVGIAVARRRDEHDILDFEYPGLGGLHRPIASRIGRGTFSRVIAPTTTTTTRGRTNMSELKGRAKEAAGNLTEDEDLKREGQTERAADKVKDGVDKIKDVLRKDK